MMLRTNVVRQMATVRKLWPMMVGFLLALSVTTATAREGGSVSLEPLAGSGVQGAATLVPQDDNIRVVIDVEGLQPGVDYQVRLYAGTPETPSASSGLLGKLTANETGRAWLQTSQMQAGGTGQMVELSGDLLADGDHFIAIFQPGLGSVAAGAIPPGTPPAPGPQATDIPEIHDVLEAAASHDLQRLLPLVRMSEVPCGPTTPEGFEVVPACGPGDSDGTPGMVLPAASCEKYWARDPEPVLQSVVDHVGTLHAIVRAPQGPLADTLSLWPEFEYLAIYAPRPGSYVRGLGLFLRDGSIVAVDVGCNIPDQLMRWGGNGTLEAIVIGP
jgi:hypothetical protein